MADWDAGLEKTPHCTLAEGEVLDVSDEGVDEQLLIWLDNQWYHLDANSFLALQPVVLH